VHLVIRGFLSRVAGVAAGAGGFGFFPASRLAANFSQSARLPGGGCPAGFVF